MRRIILIVLSLIIFISCRGTITSPNKFDNNTSGGVTSPDDSDNTEDIPEIPQPPITEEELNKYGLEINTATAENIREALEKYYKDNGESKLIFKGVSTEMYTRYSTLGTIIDEVKDINNIIVSLENVQFQNNRLPDNILGSTSFDNNNITKVILPDYITVFGNEVFFNCKSLTEVNMPKNLTEIGSSIFFNTKIKNINFPNGLRTINNSAFSVCTIESIDMPDSITSIGESVFESCSKLQSVKLSKNLSVIPKSAFASCY